MHGFHFAKIEYVRNEMDYFTVLGGARGVKFVCFEKLAYFYSCQAEVLDLSLGHET